MTNDNRAICSNSKIGPAFGNEVHIDHNNMYAMLVVIHIQM